MGLGRRPAHFPKFTKEKGEKWKGSVPRPPLRPFFPHLQRKGNGGGGEIGLGRRSADFAPIYARKGGRNGEEMALGGRSAHSPHPGW